MVLADIIHFDEWGIPIDSNHRGQSIWRTVLMFVILSIILAGAVIAIVFAATSSAHDAEAATSNLPKNISSVSGEEPAETRNIVSESASASATDMSESDDVATNTSASNVPQSTLVSIRETDGLGDSSAIVHDNQTGVEYFVLIDFGSYSNGSSTIVPSLCSDGKPYVSEPVLGNTINTEVIRQTDEFYILAETKTRHATIQVVADKTTGVEYIVTTRHGISMTPRLDGHGNLMALSIGD